MSEYCIVMTTTANEAAAASLASSLVSGKFAACVQLLNIRSFYVWEGNANDEGEVLLLIKTTEARYEDVARHIAAVHDYDVPELVKLPITSGSKHYLDWMSTMTAPD